MKSLKILLMVLLLAPLLGCPTPRPVSPTGPRPVQGPYQHPGTQMVFPEQVGDFQRVQVTVFEPTEQDVGIGYNRLDLAAPVIATVYVYPAPRLASFGSPAGVVETARAQLFANHVEQLKNEVMNAHPDAQLISDDAFTLMEAGRSHPGRKVTFEFAQHFGSPSLDSVSHIYLFQNGTWLIKYRITYPKAAAEKASGSVTNFLSALVWPGL